EVDTLQQSQPVVAVGDGVVGRLPAPELESVPHALLPECVQRWRGGLADGAGEAIIPGAGGNRLGGRNEEAQEQEREHCTWSHSGSHHDAPRWIENPARPKGRGVSPPVRSHRYYMISGASVWQQRGPIRLAACGAREPRKPGPLAATARPANRTDRPHAFHP